MTADAGIVRWLLEPNNPSVRYFTLRDVLGRAADDHEVVSARAAIPGSEPVTRVFSRQLPGGYWIDPSSPYHPKYKATYWTLMLLGRLGLDRQDERVRRAVDYILGFQRSNGGFTECSEEGARREYRYVVERRRRSGRPAPNEDSFVADHIHQMTLSCLTGNVVSALLRFGYGDESRVWQAINWLTGIQGTDGGWLCPYWRAHVRDTHSCFHGTICALEALAEIQEDRCCSSVQDAKTKAAEFLLMHRLYRADHRGFSVINRRWLRLAFPWFADYSALRALWVLGRLGYCDERMNDAVAVLRDKRVSDGTWLLESSPYGRMQVNLEKKGHPSKWVTLKVLQVLWSLGT